MSKKCCQLKNLHPSIVHLVEGVKSHPNLAAGELPKPPFPLHLKVQRRLMGMIKKSCQHNPTNPSDAATDASPRAQKFEGDPTRAPPAHAPGAGE